MKKSLVWIVLGLAGCGSGEESGSSEGTETVGEEGDESAADDDSAEDDEEPNAEDEDEDEDEDAGAPESGVVGDVCLRLDECGFLPPGIRRSDCEDTTLACLEGALQSEVADWELVARGCLDFENCFNFLDCYAGIATCEIEIDGATTGGEFTGSSTGEIAGSTSASETTGGVVDPTDASTSDSGESSTDGSPTETASGSPGGCDNDCDTCIDCAVDGPCLSLALDCINNQACIDLNGCYSDCEDTNGGGSCFDFCDVLSPDGVADFEALLSCSLNECNAC